MNRKTNLEYFSFLLLLYSLSLYVFGLAYFSSKILFLLIIITYFFLKPKPFIIIQEKVMNRTFWFIIIGIILSVLVGSIRLNGYGQIHELSIRYGNSIPLELLILVIPVFGVIIFFLKNSKRILVLLYTLAFATFIVLILIRVGIAGTAASFQPNQYLGKVGISSVEKLGGGIFYSRETFGSLDTNIYAQILSFVILITGFLLTVSKTKFQRIFLTILFVFSFHSLLKTASQSGLIQTLIVILIFSQLSYYKYKKTLRILSIIIFTIIIFAIFTINIDLFLAIRERFTFTFQLFYNLFLEGFKLGRYDTFTYRLVAAILAINDIGNNILLGTGGYRVGLIGGSGNHIDYVNWITEYGLITAVPLFIFLYLILRKNFKIRKKILKKKLDVFFYNLNTFGFCLIILVFISMIVNPLGRYIFIWPAIALSCYLISKRKLSMNKQL